MLNHRRVILLTLLVVGGVLAGFFSIIAILHWRARVGLAAREEGGDPARQLAGLIEARNSVVGTVLDVTGRLVVVQEPVGRTIRTAYCTGAPPAGIEPGRIVAVRGRYQDGLIRATSIKVVGRRRWPAAKVPVPAPGSIGHIIFLILENHSFDNYFGTYPGADGIPPWLKMPLEPGGPE